MAVAEKTQPATPSGSKYVDFDEFIEYQLRRTRNGIHQTDLLVAGIVLTCLVLGYLLVFTLFDHWVIAGGFSWIARVSLLAGLVTSVIGLGVWKLLLPYLRHINTLYAAREIERAHPELKNSLVSLVDLRRIGREVSPAILKALEKRAATEMSHADLEQAVDRKTLMRSAYVLLAIVVVMGTYTLISPKKLSTSIWRALFPTSAIAVSTNTEIVQVTPGNTEVLARSQLDVTADLAGKIPEEVTLVFSTADRRFVDEAIVMRNTGEDLPRYRARLTGDQGAGLLSNVAYRIVAGDAESPTFHITVNQPPTAAVSEVRYEYPDYMLLDEKTSSSANIDAWEGTWVTVRAKANMPVTKAIIKTSDTEDISLEAEEYPMKVDGTDLTCRWQLKFRREDGTFADYYHIQLWNEKEENDPQPTVHRIKIRPDQKPEINLIHPVSDIEAPANAVVPIVFEAHDPDFMLRRVDLKLERDGEVLGTSPRLLQAPPFVSELNQTYRLKLEDYLLKPGDQMTFYIEAHDNRALIDGYGDDMTHTSKVTITVIEPQEPEQVKAFEAEQEREAQQRLLEENPERNERQPRPQEEKQPNQKQPQDGEMGEDGDAGEAAEKEGQPGEKGAQETNDPNAADGQTTKPSPDGSQQTQDGTNNNSDMPPKDGMTEGTDSGNNSQPREDGQPGQQNQPSGTDNGGQKKQDKAAEDQALRELLEWNKRQQEKEKNQQPNPESQQQPENQDQSDPSKPDQNQTSKDNSSSDTDAAPNDNKASDQKSRPSQSMPEDGANSNSSMSEDSQDGETSSSSDATNNDSNASQPDANKPEKASDPSENNSEKSTSDGSPSGKGQESDSMDDKGTDQAQPGEVGPDAKSESGDKPPSENMKDGTGEGEKTRQAADPDTQPGEKTERGDPSENAKPSQNKNNDNNQSNDNKGTQDSQDSQKSNSSDQKQNDPSMKGNESNSDSQQQKSNDPKSSPDQNSNPSSTDTSQSKGDPNSQSSDKPGQQPSQSDSKSSDSQSQDSKSPSQSSSDSKSSDSEPKGDSSDQNSSSQDNSMKNEDGQSSKNSDDQQSKSSEPGKGSPKGSSDQQNQSDQKDADSNSQQESNSDSKQNDDGNSKQSDSKDGGQKGNQDGNQSGKQSSDGQSDPQNPQPGNQMGKGSNSPTPQSPTAGGGTGRADGDAGGTDAGDGVGPEAEAADLESKKKATSLALKRLQEQLERGETPQELLDDLGYNEQDLEKFMQRLEQRLSETAQTPESEASRRQFESLLKGIDYKSRGDVRKGNNNGDAAQGFGSGNRPVPPEFRLEQEAYKRKLSRQSASDK